MRKNGLNCQRNWHSPPALEGHSRKRTEFRKRGSYDADLKRRNLKEFDTTLTELIAIAAAATMGLSSPSAANGIPITL